MFKKKGQAAITDALFFLVIIVTLSVLMFRYSSSYGTRIEESVSDLYFKEYANSAMRTIFYTSIPLNYTLSYGEGEETDYLMTALKHDFFANQKLGKDSPINEINILDEENRDLIVYDDVVKFNLYHLVKSIMHPLNAYDYVFYMFDENDKFIFFLLKLTNFVEQEIEDPVRYKRLYAIDDREPYIWYLCDPSGYDEMRATISKSNKIYSSSIPHYLQYKNVNSSGILDLKVTTTFAIWPAIVDFNKDLEDETSDLRKLKCVKIELPDLPSD